MSTEMSEKEIYEEAKKRVKAKQGFYRHLGAYLAVNIVLVIVWALSNGPATGSGDWTGGKWFLTDCVLHVLMFFLHLLNFILYGCPFTSDTGLKYKHLKKINYNKCAPNT